MKVAIVHDYLNQFGGAERTVLAMHEAFPEAPIFTSIYNRAGLPKAFSEMDIRTTFMQRFPWVMKHYKSYLPIYPAAFASIKLDDYDVILSSSSAFAKGVKNDHGALHICYCYNPMRFVWRYEDYIRSEQIPLFLKRLLPLYLRQLKMWDVRTSAKVDHFVAISTVVARRILQFYGRDSEIIYPPVETGQFSISNEIEDYYLVVSRLKAYKRIDLVVEAFNKIGKPLKIVGEGDHGAVLRKMARSNIEFVGAASDEKLAHYYSRCRALIFPGEEDFGIVPVEAMASGRPVIAFGVGGALETVIDGETGLFFNAQTSDALIEAVQRSEKMSFDSRKIREHARSFSKETFKANIKAFVEKKYALFSKKTE